MNLAYFRKSNFDFKKTIENLKSDIIKENLEILSEIDLSDRVKLINVCNREWMIDLIKSEKNFFGLLPCSFLVLDNNGEIFVGVGNPNLISRLTDNSSILELSQRMENTLKKIVNNSCGVGPVKIRKIKLYATTTCPYCKMEASWLDLRNIRYEMVLVDINPIAAEEMVRKTGQMGVPVTEIIYDNDDTEYIIGFDKKALEEILKNY